MPLLAMAQLVRYRISRIPGRVVSWAGSSVGSGRQLGRVVSWVCGRRARVTTEDAKWPRGLKQAIFNTETERRITEDTEKKRMALRARCRWRAIHAVLWPFRPIRTADAAVLLRGPLCTSFCLRGKNRLLAADRKPPVRHGFRHGFLQRRSIGQQMVNPAGHVQTTYRSTALEQVARTSQDMRELQRHQPEAILFGWRLSGRPLNLSPNPRQLCSRCPPIRSGP